MPNIEVEVRTLLSPAERKDMLAYMGTLGEIKKIRRIMVDFSGIDRTRTVVLRVNNGQQSLVIKTGKLADTVRKEAEILIDPSQSLERTLDALAIIGYTRGMLSLRDMSVVQTSRFEYSVRDVIKPGTLERASTLLDVEVNRVVPGGEQGAQQALRQALAVHSLYPLSASAWEQWVKETYEHVDQPFEYSTQGVASLLRSLETFTST